MRLSISPETGDALPKADEIASWRLQLVPDSATRSGSTRGRPRVVRDPESGEVLELAGEATEEDAAEHGVPGYTLLAVGYDEAKRRIASRSVELDTDEPPAAETDGPLGDGVRSVLESAAQLLAASAETVGKLTATKESLAKINAEAAAAPENADRLSQLAELLTAAVKNKVAPAPPTPADPKVKTATVDGTPKPDK